MSNLENFQSDVEIMRNAEQARGEVMATFFRWLITKPEQTETEYTHDVVAAE